MSKRTWQMGRKWVVNILLLFASVVLMVAALEGMLRFTRFKHILKTPLKNYYREDQSAGYDIAENVPPFVIPVENTTFKVWSNELGCFDNPYRAEKDYILLVGDSFTWGYTPFEDKWGTILEKMLGMRVLKCGVSGYGTKQETLKMKKVAEKVGVVPKLVIVGYCSDNDFEDDYLYPNRTVTEGYLVDKTRIINKETGERRAYTTAELRTQVENYRRYNTPNAVSQPGLFRSTTWLMRNSILFNLGKYLVLDNLVKIAVVKDTLKTTGLLQQKSPPNPSSKAGQAWKKSAWDQHLNNIKELSESAQGMGSRLLVLYVPRKYHIYNFLQKGIQEDERRARVQSFCEKQNIAFFDLTPELKKYADQSPRELLDDINDLYWRYDEHWNIKGNHLVGLLLARHVLDIGLLPAVDKKEKIDEIDKETASFFKP